MGCEQTRDLAAELALGITDGEERAQALRHLAECAECRRAVEEYAAVTDELLTLAPAQQPPPGFESRVLAQLAPARPRRRLRRVLAPLAAAAAAAAVAAGAILGATSDDRRLADQYRSTLAAAQGSYFTAARLRDEANAPGGLVYGYRGTSSWIYVGLYANHRSERYRVELVLTSGRRVPLPRLRLDPATASGGQAIPVDLRDVGSVRVIGNEPGDVLAAALPVVER
jgi:putative zinc finger protein